MKKKKKKRLVVKTKRKIGEMIYKFNYLLEENLINDVSGSFRDKEIVNIKPTKP
jgi:hypothetical protein